MMDAQTLRAWAQALGFAKAALCPAAAFEQAKQFSAVTPISSLAITKLDGTAKGGVVIGISDQLKVPVKYIGLGESIDALQLFNKKQFVDSLFEKK